jgi:hypothetical protein
MELLGDVGSFGDSVNIDIRLVHGLHQMYHRIKNHFGRSLWYSYMTWVKWKLVSVHLETMLMSLDRCMVCVKHTIGSEIVVGAPNGTPR